MTLDEFFVELKKYRGQFELCGGGRLIRLKNSNRCPLEAVAGCDGWTKAVRVLDMDRRDASSIIGASDDEYFTTPEIKSRLRKTLGLGE